MTGPLHGYRILDFTWIIAGPFSSRILVEFGADVIKVEQPGSGDFYRQGDLTGARPEWGYWNYGKRSVSINLKSPKGVELCRQLAAKCDVLLENFRPGTLDRLGLGADALQELNPKLVFCSISGFGKTTSEAQRPLHAGVAHALSGMMYMIGRDEDPPFQPTQRIADTIAGTHAAAAICAALAEREHTGRGRRIEAPVYDTLVWMLGPNAEVHSLGDRPGWDNRPGTRSANTVPSGVFRARDGWLTVGGGVDDRNWKNLATAIGRSDIADRDFRWRREHQEEVHGAIERWLNEQPSAAAAEAVLLQHDVICGKVLTTAEMVKRPTLRERGTIETVQHRDLGTMDITNGPYSFDDQPPHWPGPAPRLGEHNAAVMTEILGLSAGDVAELEAEGVLYRPRG